jgi:hypothetical protein
MKRAAIALLLLVSGCSSKTAQTASGSPTATTQPPVQVTTSPPPTQTTTPPVQRTPPPLSMEDAASSFALNVQIQSEPYSVKYALIKPEDMATGREFAPLVAIDFGDTPKSFDPWQAMLDALAEGESELLTKAGIKSYAIGYSGITILLVVRVNDAGGPASLADTKKNPKFVAV